MEGRAAAIVRGLAGESSERRRISSAPAATAYFTTTLEKAAQYGKGAFGKHGDTSAYTIVSTEDPTSLVQQWGVTSVDRGIPAVFVPTNGLPSLSTPNVMTWSPFVRS